MFMSFFSTICYGLKWWRHFCSLTIECTADVYVAWRTLNVGMINIYCWVKCWQELEFRWSYLEVIKAHCACLMEFWSYLTKLKSLTSKIGGEARLRKIALEHFDPISSYSQRGFSSVGNFGMNVKEKDEKGYTFVYAAFVPFTNLRTMMNEWKR